MVALRDLAPGELIFSENPVATGPGDTRAVCIVCYTFIGDTVCNRSVTVCMVCYTFIGDTGCIRSVTVCIVCYTFIGDTVCNR